MNRRLLKRLTIRIVDGLTIEIEVDNSHPQASACLILPGRQVLELDLTLPVLISLCVCLAGHRGYPF